MRLDRPLFAATREVRGQVTELKGARRLVVWIPSIGRGLLCTLGDAAVTRVTGAAA